MQLISRREAFLKDWLVIIFSFLVRAPWREMGEVVHLFWGKDLFRDEDIGSLFKGKSSNNFIYPVFHPFVGLDSDCFPLRVARTCLGSS